MLVSRRPIQILMLLGFALWIVKSAWVCDDAYITFRVIDNLLSGFGLRWNTFERVQAYTNPLWMLLVTPVFALTRSVYLSALGLGVGMTVAVGGILVLRRALPVSLSLLLLVLLASSRAFVDFSTSGLENPASHLLLVSLVAVLHSPAEPRRVGRVAVATLLVALLAVNRQDGILLVLPALMYYIWERRAARPWLGVLVGMLPLLAWESLSLVYYGFLVPNTAYAKLNTGVPNVLLWRQGALYLWDSIRRDPVTPLTIVLGMSVAFRKAGIARSVAVGIALHLAYVVSVGGDFMRGRFLTPAFVVAVALLAFHFPKRWALRCSALAVVVAVFGPSGPEHAHGIGDERAYRLTETDLPSVLRNGGRLPAELRRTGQSLRRQQRAAGVPLLAAAKQVGIIGFYAGPHVRVLDRVALGDPLLARLPTQDALHWRIGHFVRRVPDGYEETLSEGVIRLRDPNLAEYYRRLCLVTRAPVWSPERWREIWRFHTGGNEALRRAYLAVPDTRNLDGL